MYAGLKLERDAQKAERETAKEIKQLERQASKPPAKRARKGANAAGSDDASVAKPAAKKAEQTKLITLG